VWNRRDHFFNLKRQKDCVGMRNFSKLNAIVLNEFWLSMLPQGTGNYYRMQMLIRVFIIGEYQLLGKLEASYSCIDCKF